MNERQSLKLDAKIVEALADAQYEEKKATGKKPTLSELVERAWKFYSAAGAPKPVAPTATGYNPANRELHDKLETVLNSGDEMTIRAVVPNIEIFFERLRPAPAQRKNGN